VFEAIGVFSLNTQESDSGSVTYDPYYGLQMVEAHVYSKQTLENRLKMRVRTIILCLALVLALVPGLVEAQRYEVMSAESIFKVGVGKAGLLSVFGAGHKHLIEVRSFTGNVNWNKDNPEVSRFVMEVDANSLAIMDEQLSDDDRTKIQADMESKALALEQYLAISFESNALQLLRTNGSAMRGELTGILTLRSISRAIRIPLMIQVEGSHLRVKGVFEIKGRDFGVEQISALWGAVKTKNEIEVSFDIIAAHK